MKTPEELESLPLKSSAKKKICSYSASNLEQQMLHAVAEYHSFSKSAMLTSLVKKEFWRIFPSGTVGIPADERAFVARQGR